MRCLRSLFCILVVVSVVPSASAQQITASIRGNISDPSGAVVQEASVTAKQAETGLIRTVMSSHAANIGPTLGSASAAALKYLR